jgi:hypothetical protein
LNPGFESAVPSIIKSVRQRELFNVWQRMSARGETLPMLASFKPNRLDDEMLDIMICDVAMEDARARFVISFEAERFARAYSDVPGKGRYLEDFVGARRAPTTMPLYDKCVDERLPVYSVCNVPDSAGREVTYERLLMPFGDATGARVTQILASLKCVSLDGAFEVRQLMQDDARNPVYTVRAVIDHCLAPYPPQASPAGDVIEI